MIHTRNKYTADDDNNKITYWLGNKIQWPEHSSSFELVSDFATEFVKVNRELKQARFLDADGNR